MSAPTWQELDWADPTAEFRIFDDGDPHGRLCIVFPGGQLVDIGCHADPVVDEKRAAWICAALNAARAEALAAANALPTEKRDGTADAKT